MKTDSRIYENLGEVIALNLVGGDENTATWDGTVNVPYLEVTLDGIELDANVLDRHHGRTRVIRGYQINGGWEKRVVRNERQVSVATLDDLREIAESLDIVGTITDHSLTIEKFMSQALGVNLTIDGENLARLMGPGTKLLIGDPETGTIIDVSEAHLPCKKPAFAIARGLAMDSEALKQGFRAVAAERRGYIAGVFSAGKISVGDQVSFQPPIDHKTLRAAWKS